VESLNGRQCNGDLWLQSVKCEYVCLQIVSVNRHERKCLTKIPTLSLYKTTPGHEHTEYDYVKCVSVLPVGLILLAATGEDILDVPFLNSEAWFHSSAYIGGLVGICPCTQMPFSET
jgi:hypothetical protein